jgi:hypothetical protein
MFPIEEKPIEPGLRRDFGRFRKGPGDQGSDQRFCLSEPGFEVRFHPGFLIRSKMREL